LAESIGRTRANRGKEPNFTSPLPGRNPLSIPGHPTINGYTAKGILKVLEADLDCMEDLLDAEEEKQKKIKNENPEGISSTAVCEDSDSGGT
jgi:hypothetical protein